VYTRLRTRVGNLNTIKRYRELCVLNVFLREHNIFAESQMCFIIIIIISSFFYTSHLIIKWNIKIGIKNTFNESDDFYRSTNIIIILIAY